MKRSAIAAFLALAAVATPHDIWIEPSAGWVLPGGWIDLSLMLGNHGNHHRDFKLASKVDTEDKSLTVITPLGKKIDLGGRLQDTNPSADDQGYWTARFDTKEQGIYTAVSTMDKVMSYAPVRDIKSAKAFFGVGAGTAGKWSVPIGAPLELIPPSLPSPVKVGDTIGVRVLFKGKPMPKAKVSFVPRWGVAKGEFDSNFERIADAKGFVSMTMREANTYLIATHYKDLHARGKGYESINYSATICLVTER